jgi:hypothetical protein
VAEPRRPRHQAPQGHRLAQPPGRPRVLGPGAGRLRALLVPAGERVVCSIDEKTSIQAKERRAPRRRRPGGRPARSSSTSATAPPA